MAEINELGTLLGLLQQGFTPDQARQQLDEAKAMQMAKMTGREMTRMGLIQGGQDLRRGLMAALGQEAQDPTLQMASRIRQLGSQFDLTTADGMMQYARALQQVNPQMAQQAAMQAQKLREQEATVGLRQAQAAEVTSRAGREERLATEAQAKADRETQKRIEDERRAQAALQSRKTALLKRNPSLSEEEAEALAEDPAVVREMLKVPKKDTVNTKTVTVGGRVLLINAETGETVKDLGTASKTLEESLGAGLAAVANVMAKKQGEAAGAAGGKGVGEQVFQIQGKEDALTAVRSALDLVKNGIYAGGYGPMKEALAKFTPIGSKDRLTNTEQFRATIGEVVIPRLQEFGGNDSVEELKYLRSVVAGETTLEPAAIRRILESAERKIQRGVQRIQQQQQAVQQGKPLPTDVRPERQPRVVDWNSLPGGR
jgi:hypothetical protein